MRYYNFIGFYIYHVEIYLKYPRFLVQINPYLYNVVYLYLTYVQ